MALSITLTIAENVGELASRHRVLNLVNTASVFSTKPSESLEILEFSRTPVVSDSFLDDPIGAGLIFHSSMDGNVRVRDRAMAELRSDLLGAVVSLRY